MPNFHLFLGLPWTYFPCHLLYPPKSLQIARVLLLNRKLFLILLGFLPRLGSYSRSFYRYSCQEASFSPKQNWMSLMGSGMIKNDVNLENEEIKCMKYKKRLVTSSNCSKWKSVVLPSCIVLRRRLPSQKVWECYQPRQSIESSILLLRQPGILEHRRE